MIKVSRRLGLLLQEKPIFLFGVKDVSCSTIEPVRQKYEFDYMMCYKNASIRGMTKKYDLYVVRKLTSEYYSFVVRDKDGVKRLGQYFLRHGESAEIELLLPTFDLSEIEIAKLKLKYDMFEVR